jgi:DNA-directed RNA polymerase subunit H (RpoH/RPB5)
MNIDKEYIIYIIIYMSVNPLLLPIKKDHVTIKNTVLTNIIKMLIYRKWINKDNEDIYTENLLKQKNNNNVYSVNIDINLLDMDFYDELNDVNVSNSENTFDTTKIYIKLLPVKISGTTKISNVSEFLSTYKNNHKILVVDEISEKPMQQFDETKFTEVFEEKNLMINLMEHYASPQYEVLTKNEITDFLDSYQVKKIKLSKMFQSDPASRYLYLKKGQIVRILRNSNISGLSIAYRIIKKGNAFV